MVKNICFICQNYIENNPKLFKARGNCCKKCDDTAQRIVKTIGYNNKEKLRSLWLEDYKLTN